MDKISVVGLLLGFLAIVLGQVLEGGHVGSLVQPTAFFIVIGGTLGAVMLQSPLPTFLLGARMARWVIFPAARGAGPAYRPGGPMEHDRPQGGTAGAGGADVDPA